MSTQSETNVLQESDVTCPECGNTTSVSMPEDACVYFWECPECGSIVKPRNDDCCVCCSYGTVPCPPVQKQRTCCQNTA